jgi:glycosyltransferase involved in cell wall biosynthesis
MFVITSMPVGGAEVLLANLVRGLDRKRFRPEIVCLKEPGPIGLELAKELPVHSHLLAGKYDLRILPRLIQLFRQRNVAAVITVGAGDKMFWGRLAGWLAGVPAIFSALHSTGWPDGVSRLNRRLTRITDGFIAVATPHAQHMIDNERFPAEKVVTIRNGVDTDRFVPDVTARAQVRQTLGISLDSPVFGIVAALRPEKNHAMFIRTALRVVHQVRDAKFLVIGDGPERPLIEQMINAAQLPDSIFMLGSRQDTPALLAALDGFLLTSHNEASPVSILEALSCQVPVVSTDVGSVGESVINNETGFLVTVDDDEAMAARVLQLIQSPDLAARLGKQGRQLVIDGGSLQSMIAGYSQLIESSYDQRSATTNPPELLTDRRRFPRDANGKPILANEEKGVLVRPIPGESAL